MVKPETFDVEKRTAWPSGLQETETLWTAQEYRAAALNAQYQNTNIHLLIEEMVDFEFAGRVALVSSFGTQSSVLLALISDVDKNLPVLFIDTGKLFPQTLSYRDQLVEKFGLTNVRAVKPSATRLAGKDPHGALWMKDVSACCHIRKVEPLEETLQGYDAWFSGRKRYQSDTRSRLQIFEADGEHIKINPLADWTWERLEAFSNARNLPAHPLLAEGYKSVGCAPCTIKTPEGGDERAGRWAGQNKTECGIHFLKSDGKNARER